jgi:hypothetical protein
MRRKSSFPLLCALCVAAGSLAWPAPAWAQWGPYPYPYPYRWAGPEADVRVIAKPRNAAVYVDGYLAGIVDDFDGTWQRLRVTPGQHEITLYLEGYRTVTQKLYLQVNGTQTLRTDMEKLPEGEKSEPVPVPAPPPQSEAPGAPPPGTPPPGWLPPPQPAPAPQPAPRPAPAPQPVPSEATTLGTLSIRVNPGGTEILIDGQPQPGPPANEVLLVQLPEGKHQIEVRRKGYEPYSTDVEVRRGETNMLNVVLARR